MGGVEMRKETQESIAREGLIFIFYSIITFYFSYKDALPRRFSRGTVNLNFDKFFWDISLWLIVYFAIRFIIWAIKILENK